MREDVEKEEGEEEREGGEKVQVLYAVRTCMYVICSWFTFTCVCVHVFAKPVTTVLVYSSPFTFTNMYTTQIHVYTCI